MCESSVLSEEGKVTQTSPLWVLHVRANLAETAVYIIFGTHAQPILNLAIHELHIRSYVNKYKLCCINRHLEFQAAGKS